MQSDASGVIWKVLSDAQGWTVEVAIPRALLKDCPEKPGQKMSCFIQVTRANDGGGGKVELTNAPIRAAETLRWPFLVLQP